MPLYEYDCERCGTFEVTQKMNEPPLTTHEGCGEKVTKLISRSSFQLKGGGWYADGYSSGNTGSSCSSGRCGS
jgi:putative FmdB family regulatory protein